MQVSRVDEDAQAQGMKGLTQGRCQKLMRVPKHMEWWVNSLQVSKVDESAKAQGMKGLTHCRCQKLMRVPKHRE